MSVTAADVERWARALGVWRDDGMAPDESRRALGRQWVMWAAPWTKSADCKFWIRVWSPAAPDRLNAWTSDAVSHGPLDPLTAALILLGHARGLRVDVGECPACRERGSAVERRWLHGNHSTREMLDLEQAGFRCNWGGALVDAWPYERPCPACTIDGKPTGRHTLTWEVAIIAAMPSLGGKDVHERAQANGKSVSEWHRQVREALRVMAHTIAGPEHVAIVGDWCAGHVDNTAANFPGEPAGGLGKLVTAWLRGECPACGGNGHHHPMPLDGLRASEAHDTTRKCTRCNGHGSVLGGFERELAQAIEAELGRWAA